MFCISCGAPLPEKAAFCPACGAKQADPAPAEKRLTPAVCTNCGSSMLKRVRRGEYRCEHCGSWFRTEEQEAAGREEEREARLAAVFVEAEAYMAKEAYHDELRVLTGGLDIAPDSSDLMLRLGRVHQKLGHPKKAMEYYREAEALNPDDPIVYVNYGSLCLSQGQFADARSQFEKGLEIIEADPLSASKGDICVAYGNYAWCIGKLGDIPGAKKYLALAKDMGYRKESIDFLCRQLHLNPRKI